MVDVLSMAGNVWQTLTRTEPTPPPFLVSLGRDRFCCGNRIPVEPGATIHEMNRADIVILPELWARARRAPERPLSRAVRVDPCTLRGWGVPVLGVLWRPDAC